MAKRGTKADGFAGSLAASAASGMAALAGGAAASGKFRTGAHSVGAIRTGLASHAGRTQRPPRTNAGDSQRFPANDHRLEIVKGLAAVAGRRNCHAKFWQTVFRKASAVVDLQRHSHG